MNLKKYQFKDNDFEMDINVSIEERTIYMNQKEISILLNVNKGTVSRFFSKKQDFQMGQVSKNGQNGNISATRVAQNYDFEIIKEIGEKYNKDRIIKLEKWLSVLLEKQLPMELDNNYEIVRYSQDNLDINVRLDSIEETIWLAQNEIAFLYGTSRPTISEHIANIFNDEELEKNSVCRNFRLTGNDGKTYNILLYNLDMILAIGYRVRTVKAIKFRRWASAIIKSHIKENGLLEKISLIEDSNLSLSTKYIELSKSLEMVKKDIEELKPKEIVFYRNVSYNAYSFLSIVVSIAKKEVFIIDPYADRFTLSFLNIVSENIKIYIVLAKDNQINEEEIDVFKKSHPTVDIVLIVDKNEHDRFIFIDRSFGYSIGQSLNSFGYYDVAIIKISDTNIIKTKIDRYYDN